MYVQRTPARPLQRPQQSFGQKLTNTLLGPPAERSLKRIFGTIVGVSALLLLLAGIIRTAIEGRHYANLPWKAYSAADGSFKVKFPGDPTQSTESQNINGDMWQVVTLQSRHRNHLYAVEYVDLHMVVAKPRDIMERFANAVLGEDGGKRLSGEETTLAKNPALTFSAIVPAKSKGSTKFDTRARMRGIMVLRNHRLFFVWTAAGVIDPHKKDLTDFIASFEVPPPVEVQLIF